MAKRTPDQCPGGMPIQKGKVPTKNGPTFPVLDGTPFGAVTTNERPFKGEEGAQCALRHVSENSTNGSGSWEVGCRRKGCEQCFWVKNLNR